jgi:hypothetical protein
MKSGITSSELWLTTIATGLSALLASNLIPATGPYGQLVGAIGTIVLPAIYAYLRTKAKISDGVTPDYEAIAKAAVDSGKLPPFLAK